LIAAVAFSKIVFLKFRRGKNTILVWLTVEQSIMGLPSVKTSGLQPPKKKTGGFSKATKTLFLKIAMD